MSIFQRNILSRTHAFHRVLSTRHLSSSAVRRKDPWSLPHTPEHIASTTSPANTPPPKPLPRPGEPIETTRARLIYQSRKRGTLESDLLLSTFAQEHLGTMDAEALSEFDKVRASSSDHDASYPHFIFLAYGRTGLGHLLLGHGETNTP